jgi:hypothetical protein
MQGPALNMKFAGYDVRPATEADIAACNLLCRRVHGFERGVELREAISLMRMFQENFVKYEQHVDPDVRSARLSSFGRAAIAARAAIHNHKLWLWIPVRVRT